MEIPNLRALQVAKITGEGQNMNQGSINPLTLNPNKRDDKRKIKQSKIRRAGLCIPCPCFVPTQNNRLYGEG